MNVADLKELLATWPDDTEIILSIDEEGNGFYPLVEYGAVFVERGTVLPGRRIDDIGSPDDPESIEWMQDPVIVLLLWP